ncbi:MAG TPA: lytic murein transglycosylase B [Burkholderiales bacterium]|jgi:membrane-bound lytic murein transglycosylase B|nr:lytic murein transglycosylase B [Burkholderiales bacterium]
MNRRIAMNVLLLAGMGAGLITAAPAQAPDRVSLTPAVEAFIERLRERHGLDAERLRETFRQIKPQDGVIRAFTAPATSRPWHQFRSLFVTPLRIEGGVAFWRDHHAVLAQARAAYGVPEEVIVAILGVETIYGRHLGNFRVIDSLYTLGFHGPRRNEFFLSELEEFLLLSRENSLDPLQVKGSFAGAMGMPQFIASSYRRYAVDFNADGRIDLWNDVADVVGSVANYLKNHGWAQDQAVAVPARLLVNDVQHLVDLGVKPHLTVSEMKMRGVEALEALPPDLPAGVFTLENAQGNEHWLSLNNFYVITRYNRSKNYAMAVHQLAVAIAQARQGQPQAIETVATPK